MIKREFNDTGNGFEAYKAAVRFVEESGYSYGSMQRDAPTAIFKGDRVVAKWRNLSLHEQQNCDGKITGNFRDGPVVVEIYK